MRAAGKWYHFAGLSGGAKSAFKGPRGARANGLSTSDGHAQLGLSRPSLGPSARAEDRSDAWAPRGEVGALGEYYRCPADGDGCRDMPNASELPAEPGSGSEGSSTVESTSTTRKRSDAGLLCISLMHDLNNVLGRAAKTGRRPVITIRGAPGRSPSNGCLAGTGGMPSSHPPNGDHGTRVCHEDSRLRAPFGCRRRQGCRR